MDQLSRTAIVVRMMGRPAVQVKGVKDHRISGLSSLIRPHGSWQRLLWLKKVQEIRLSYYAVGDHTIQAYLG